MARKLTNWLAGYAEYTHESEAPGYINTWAGIGVIGGALRRKVWIPFPDFKWYPNFFIIFVAPPGTVAKTTSMGKATSMLKEVEGIFMGPDSITWQRLAQKFPSYRQDFEYEGNNIEMSAVTIASGELDNLLDFENSDMIGFYTSIWEGRDEYRVETKTAGNDLIKGPCITVLGCTTPHWITRNINADNVGGGFASRCIFIYANRKERRIAYPKPLTPGQEKLRRYLVEDLTDIANMVGPMTLTPEANAYGDEAYQVICDLLELEKDEAFHGYLSRKQTQIHKVAMALSASRDNSRVIQVDDIKLAYMFLTEQEPGFQKIFSRLGRSEDSVNAEVILDYIKEAGMMKAIDSVNYARKAFPHINDYDSILQTLIRSGNVEITQIQNDVWLKYVGAP